MDPERWRRIEDLFHAAAALDGDARRDLLERACAGEPALRREVEDLLRHDRSDAGTCAAAVHEAARQAGLEEPELAPGIRIGRYRIAALVGRGGMGDVYEAEQESPVRRRVALKLIRTGMDTRTVVARFESERQALAVMDHPAIARVFDAGATERGRPYFTMEFVEGVPITRYCDAGGLGLHARLELFLQVCDGVQHAHQKGIIHRDLKPSNVLVGATGGRPAPKIIDFGVAKAIEPRPEARTLLTEAGQSIGTPEYMSPEQAAPSDAGVDTRTDVYSLGVILYELLTGSHPYAGARRDGSAEALRRAILDTDPPRPSTRAGGRGADAVEAARRRGADPRALARRLRGDLDVIALKALEKEPARRYASPAELAADLRRHLQNQPVLARAPELLYRTGKLVRRHKVGAAAAAIVLAAVVAGIAGTAAGLVRARRAERQARREAATAGQVSKFLIDLFEVSDPDQARGRTITAREILDRGAQQIETLEGQPVVRARLMSTIGKVYSNLGIYDTARGLLEGSLRIRRESLPSPHADVAEGLRLLGNFETDAGDRERAVALLREALAEQRAADGGRDSRASAILLHDLGHAHYLLSRYDEAEPLYRRAREILERDPGERDTELALCTGSLAQTLHALGKFEEAERLFRRTVSLLQPVFGADHPEVALMRHNLAAVLHDLRRLDEAEALYRESLAVSERVQGEGHPAVADTLVNLARLLREKGDLAAAEAMLRRSLAIDVRLRGEADETVAYDLKELAHLERAQGKARQAEATYRRSLAIYRGAVSGDSPYLAVTLNGLGELLMEEGRAVEAEPLLRESVAVTEAALPPDHWVRFTAQSLLGAALGGAGRHAQGEPLLVGSYEGFRASLGDANPRTRSALLRLVRFYETWPRPDGASLAAEWRARLDAPAPR